MIDEIRDSHPEGEDYVQGTSTPETIIPTPGESLGPRGIGAITGKPVETGSQLQSKPGDSFDVTDKPSATRGLTSRGVSAMSGEVSEDK